MPIIRPTYLPLDNLGDDEAYGQARLEFANLLLSRRIIDPLGRQVLFRHGFRGGLDQAEFAGYVDPPRFDTKGRVEDDCWHVCFKEADRNPRYSRLPREVFKVERAKRIPLILTALTDPDTRIHECQPQGNDTRQSYSLFVPGEPKLRVPNEFFAAIVRKLPNPEEVAFVTAYSLDNQAVLDGLRRQGPQIYPAKTAKKGGSGKRNRGES